MLPTRVLQGIIETQTENSVYLRLLLIDHFVQESEPKLRLPKRFVAYQIELEGSTIFILFDTVEVHHKLAQLDPRVDVMIDPQPLVKDQFYGRMIDETGNKVTIEIHDIGGHEFQISNPTISVPKTSIKSPIYCGHGYVTFFIPSTKLFRQIKEQLRISTALHGNLMKVVMT